MSNENNYEEEETVEFKGIIHLNHDIDDKETFAALPSELKTFYREANGLVAYNGGFQMRGCVNAPEWNSLAAAWTGENAFHKTYKSLKADDVPFAQDCLGDQYIYRAGSVWHLLTETGELDDLELDFDEFLDEVNHDPVEFLALYPLIEYMDAGNELEPGELLSPSLPFTVETEKEIVFEKMANHKRLANLKAYYLSL